ncbi:hypothetical protein [Pseudonocardia sp.]|jgi:hypothetical protein|uniref:hypothetical protein n=1 Tax=Pseudonocardia sp. TaxID=60912 RepID=UPI0026391DC3|nr:hypothetical protein [Pseudonocardia sp.]MCW2722078.1 uncharacterized protein [Pseudonocardia sp.]MDT7618140.1 hypothetical protein [Pseudonocardiales bacterium]
MGWIHDSGYRPAYAHEGYPASVLLDGTDTGSSSRQIEPSVVGWRAACECGWRGGQFYPRAEWPSSTGMAPEGVEGWQSGTGTFSEWQRHLDRALPELAVHDLARTLAVTEMRLREAVDTARRAGLSWSRIGAVAGMTGEQAVRRLSIEPRSAPPRGPIHDRRDRMPPRHKPASR